MSSIRRLVSFGPADKTTRPSKSNLRFVFDVRWVERQKIAYFPKTIAIWLTSLAGIGELPDQMTNDWYIIGAESKDVESKKTTGSAEADEALVPNDASDGPGGTKAATKEATTEAGLPDWDDAASEEE